MSEFNIKYIPAIYPDVNFSDRKLFSCRVAKEPQGEIIKKFTEKEFATIDNPLANIKILTQSTHYDKYFFFVYGTESQNFNFVTIAESCEIITDDNQTINAFGITIETVLINDSQKYEYKISFLHLKNDDCAISNYLSSIFLLKKYAKAQLWQLQLSNSKNIDDNYPFVSGKIITKPLTEAEWSRISSGTYSTYYFIIENTNNIYVGDVLSIAYSPTETNISNTAIVTEMNPNKIKIKITAQSANLNFTSSILTLTWNFASTLKYIFYTKLIPEFYTSLVKQNVLENDNSSPLDVAVYTGKTRIVMAEFYLTIQESLDFDWLIDVCDDIQLVSPDGTIYQSLGNIKQEYGQDDKALLLCRKRTVKMNYQELNYFHLVS